MKTRNYSYNRDSSHGSDDNSDYSSLGGASSDSDYIVARKKSVNKFDKEASDNSKAEAKPYSKKSHTSDDSDWNHSGDRDDNRDDDGFSNEDCEARQEIHSTNDTETSNDSKAKSVPYSKNSNTSHDSDWNCSGTDSYYGGDSDENSDDDDFGYEDSEARQSSDSVDGSDYSVSESSDDIYKREIASGKYNGKYSNAVMNS
jgi:hypothetical protein